MKIIESVRTIPTARVEPCLLTVWFNGEMIAETRCAYRLLEISHPPTYYFPPRT